jgi:hypothetical protein
MPRDAMPDWLHAMWPNCTVPDCSNKIAFGLSETHCFPHHFKLPMDQDGRAVYPDKETEATYQRFYRTAVGYPFSGCVSRIKTSPRSGPSKITNRMNRASVHTRQSRADAPQFKS